MKQFVTTLVLGLIAVAGLSQSVLLTFATFQTAMHSLEGYTPLTVINQEGNYEALLADADGNRIQLTIKNYQHCQPYIDGGRKLLLSDREAYAVESASFTMLTAPLPEFMACLHIVSSVKDATDQLLDLAAKMPFLGRASGSASWPEFIPSAYRIPGLLLWTNHEASKADGFAIKVTAEIEATEQTLNWFDDLPCGCTNQRDYADCTAFILTWQHGRITDLKVKAKIAERLRFSYYIR